MAFLSTPRGVLHQSDCHWAERTISRSLGPGRVGPTPNLIMEIGPNFNQQIRSRSVLIFPPACWKSSPTANCELRMAFFLTK